MLELRYQNWNGWQRRASTNLELQKDVFRGIFDGERNQKNYPIYSNIEQNAKDNLRIAEFLLLGR